MNEMSSPSIDLSTLAEQCEMNSDKSFVFNRCGLAALSDFETPEWRGLFTLLEHEQSEFLAHEPLFPSPEYKWPRDPLRTWSRAWEYPYIYHHIDLWRSSKFAGSYSPLILDIGSGVTFFPFTIAKLGCHVICADTDPICEEDISRAIECVDHHPGKVEFRLIDSQGLPFDDGMADAIYCISVLEHIPDFEKTVEEMARILRPGGSLFLTVDLDLRGNAEIGVARYNLLIDCLAKWFRLQYPEFPKHPGDTLISTRGPFPLKDLTGLDWVWFSTKQWLIKPLLGLRPVRYSSLRLAVKGWVLEKR